jgi:hypothetical protein
MWRFIILGAIACMAHLAQAAEAGKVIFVAGKASVAEQPAVDGAPVGEGQMLSTGADGFLYVKTIDSGLFILRPNTRARIVTYHVDDKNPANTQVKLELLSGVARSKSGNAVKQARQNFRFNTPVAAIGVRGTDFTVFTDNDTSRVAVISGAIVMSGFAGSCSPDGAGPCEGSASRELRAAQRGQLLQLQRGQATPQLLQSSPLSPDQVSPPRADEPLAHAASTGGGANSATGQPNLDVQKTVSLNDVINKAPPPPVLPPPVTPPPVEGPLQLPDRGIVWGRWQVVAGKPPSIILSMAQEQNDILAVNGNFALLRARGTDNYIAPNNGNIGFQLRNSEAFVYTDYTSDYRVATPATLTNGTLTVDFGKKTFETGFDLSSNVANTRLQAGGTVGSDGQLHGDATNGRSGYVNVQGLLSSQKGGSAAYIFDGRLDDKRTVNGVTYWERTTR